MSEIDQFVFRVTAKDNVATALTDLEPGETIVRGEGDKKNVICLETISNGHKIALCDIAPATPVIKYGVVIGETTKEIKEGSWVHLQNMKSLYDERSSTLDIHTGAPTDTKYI